MRRGYYEAVGYWPFDELPSALSMLSNLEAMQRLSEDQREQEYGERRVIRGVLQLVASRLIGQATKESAGHNEMYDGLIALENFRTKNREAYTKAARDAQENPSNAVGKAMRTEAKAKRSRPRRA